MLGATQSNSTDSGNLQQHLDAYLTEACNQRHSPPKDPIEYWKSSQYTYPQLALVTKQFCASPPSSVDSERTFSLAGLICDDRRSNLTPAKTEMLLFLMKNLDVVRFDY